jgi:hypothetical protein
MKRLSGIIVLAVALLAPQVVRAQGTVTYLSNLEQASAGSLVVGSNSWLAALFFTGANHGGYVLNSIQLGMTDASGSPSGFTAMLCPMAVGTTIPGISLGTTLDGSLNPVSAGIFTYTSASNLTLSPNRYYFVVLTAGTAVANGAYDWSYVGAQSYNPSGGWSDRADVYISSDGLPNGLSWHTTGNYAQFAINATAIPEPGVLGLFRLGGLCFLWHYRKAKAV